MFYSTPIKTFYTIKNIHEKSIQITINGKAKVKAINRNLR